MTAPRKLEKSVVTNIMSKLKTIPESKWEKRHGGKFGKIGRPDITGCLLGQRFEFEVKRDEKGETTPAQEKELRTWREAGAITALVWSWEQVADIIASFLVSRGRYELFINKYLPSLEKTLHKKIFDYSMEGELSLWKRKV